MRILVLGSTGQVGQSLAEKNFSGHEVILSNRSQAPMDRPDELIAFVRSKEPQLIINAAAYTAVDRAETERELALTVNSDCVGELARYCASTDSGLIHYSTDYVFDGSGDSPRSEASPTAPLNFYGSSKLKGEEQIRTSGAKHLIFRTSWVISPFGHNFIKTMLRLASEKESLSIVDDQVGSPTSALCIARATEAAVNIFEKDPMTTTGTYNLTNSGFTSWYNLAKETFQQWETLGHSIRLKELKAISSDQYPTPAKRPLNSRLNTTKFKDSFNYEMPPWEEALNEILRRL